MTMEFRLLRRTFLRRFLDNELLSFGADAGPQALIWMLAVGIAPSILLPFSWVSQYSLAFKISPALVMEMQWGHIVGLYQLAMVSTGVATALVWEALLLDRRDVLVLSPLPVSWRTVGLAKVSALMVAWAAFALAVSVTPSFIFSSVAMNGGLLAALAFFVTHLLGALCASAFVFASLVALQALLLNTLSATAFRRMVTIVQGLLFFATLAFVIVRPTVSAGQWPEMLAHGKTLIYFPPMWFLGLAETLRGSEAEGFHAAGRVALVATSTSVVVAALALAAGFRRHVRRTVESPEMAMRGAAGLLTRTARRIAHALIPDPVERSTFDFVTRSLARSPRHRLLIGGATGLGVALSLPGLVSLAQALSAAAGDPAAAPRLTIAILAVPQSISFLLLVALRVSFRLPTDIGAAWVVRLVERPDAAIYLAGVRKVMVAIGVLPPMLLMTPAIWWGWGLVTALQQLLFMLLLSTLLVSLLLGRFRSVPFTVVAIGVADPHPARWPLFVTGFILYSATVAGILQRLLLSPRAYAIGCGLLLLAIAADRWRRRRPREGPTGLIFDLEPDDATVHLNLVMSPRG